MGREKTKLDSTYLLAYGIDFKNRTISFGNIESSDNSIDAEYVNTDFSPTNVEMAVRAIHEMVSQNPKAPITIRMCSPGGSLDHGLYMKDVILSSPCQFKFIGGGIVASCGSIIMAVCDERYLHKDTFVMLHEHSSSTSNKHSNMKIDVNIGNRYADVMAELYSDNSLMDKDFYSNLLGSGRDIWMWADEVVTLGLAEKVIPHQKRGKLRVMRAENKAKGINTEKLQKTIQKIHDRSSSPVLAKVKVEIVMDEIDDSLEIVENKPEETNT